MNNTLNIKTCSLLLTVCFFSITSFAQKDSTKKQTIDITSSYKPVLRNAVKINFSATHLNADTGKSVSPYNVPSQNLFYTYQPVSLRPLALTVDTGLNLGIRNFLKAGVGNYSTPYVSAGFSFGDGKTSLVNIYGDYVSSKGSIKNQDYAGINLKAAGSYFTLTNEFYGSASVNQQDHYFYGYDHQLYADYKKEDLLQRYQTLNLKAGLRNKASNGSGINYDPNIEINLFSNQNKASETSLAVTAPVDKSFTDEFTIKVTAKADITSYSSKAIADNLKFTNNIFSIAPELIYAKPLFNIHAGVTPSWDNNKLSVFPNIYGEAKIRDKIFLVQAGIVGRFIKNNYQYLTSVNPYQILSSQQNTKETEIYGGIKATIGSHFNFSAKASWITYHNLPFFVNDTTDGKTFYLVNESKVSDFRIHGDVSFISQDKFTVTGGLTFNGYNGMKDNDRAWGTIPLELDASLRWWAFKQVLIKGDFMAFNGAAFLLKDGNDIKLGGGADLSAGLEFAINKRFSAWMDINNIFNNKYQRWNNYPVYGLNILAGAIIRF